MWRVLMVLLLAILVVIFMWKMRWALEGRDTSKTLIDPFLKRMVTYDIVKRKNTNKPALTVGKFCYLFCGIINYSLYTSAYFT